MNHLVGISCGLASHFQHAGDVTSVLAVGVLVLLRRSHPLVGLPHPIVGGAQEEAGPLVAGSPKLIADRRSLPDFGPRLRRSRALAGLTGRAWDSGPLVECLHGLAVPRHEIHGPAPSSVLPMQTLMLLIMLCDLPFLWAAGVGSLLLTGR